MSFFYYNGNFYEESTAVLNPSNRGLKYGEGLFETMKLTGGKIIFLQDHIERLFYGMKILEFDTPAYFTEDFFKNRILDLANKNDHSKNVRIRLMVFRGDGDIHNFKHIPQYIIQTSEISFAPGLNSDGLIIDIYPYVKKSCDLLSNIKTNNFLPYTMASLYAIKNNYHDCVILNTYERLCDTSIANIFIVKNETIYTPSLSEGCIAGIVRKMLLTKLEDYIITEKPITLDELKNADEVFLTNSIYDLCWVKQVGNKKYKNTLTQKIYQSFTKTI